MDVNEFLEQFGVKPGELAHYGVKGMKWGTNNAPVAKGISTADSAGTGGDSDNRVYTEALLDTRHTSQLGRQKPITWTTKGFVSHILENWGDTKIKMNGKTRIKPGILTNLLHLVGIKQSKKK